MKPTPGFITSLDPPMVTAEVEKPNQNNDKYWSDKIVPGNKSFLSDTYQYDLQEYHKAIEPMPVENVIGNIICLEDCSNEWIKLNLKVLFIKTETGCRVTKIS